MRADLVERLEALAFMLDKRRYPDNAELVREAAAALRAVEGWRSMESAPKDGRAIFWLEPKPEHQRARHDKNGRCVQGGLAPFAHCCHVGYWDSAYEPTHWMPVPLPPAGEGVGGG